MLRKIEAIEQPDGSFIERTACDCWMSGYDSTARCTDCKGKGYIEHRHSADFMRLHNSLWSN